MHDIAIVCEGLTDFQVIKNVLLGWYKWQPEEPFLKQMQPNPAASGESAWQQYGGWENVVRFLKAQRHRDALAYSHYLVIQIDSDQSEHPNFAVPQQIGGAAVPPQELVSRIRDFLAGLIGTADMQQYAGRIIFAVCVRDIECWMLPLWDTKKAAKCEGCLDALNRALAKNDKRTISPSDKLPRLYEEYSKGYRKRKTLLDEGKINPSLGIFLEELQSALPPSGVVA